ncbi:uncharacterized protein LOC143024141 isoform X4 [Oratosquilla oratoria]|uniref:uncharacterized protein LOC143024141 isoform X4 n=1 Tax=Oratosquilla oratoria TaxID=337810 RepID=UPI003F75D140
MQRNALSWCNRTLNRQVVNKTAGLDQETLLLDAMFEIPGSDMVTAARDSSTSTPVLQPGSSSTPVLQPGSSSTPLLQPGSSSTPVLQPDASSDPVLQPGLRWSREGTPSSQPLDLRRSIFGPCYRSRRGVAKQCSHAPGMNMSHHEYEPGVT